VREYNEADAMMNGDDGITPVLWRRAAAYGAKVEAG
jgi:hypothetical protein